MTTSVSVAIDAKVAERAMLKHPFYQAWTEGRLPLDTLRDYRAAIFSSCRGVPASGQRGAQRLLRPRRPPDARRKLAEEEVSRPASRTMRPCG